MRTNKPFTKRVIPYLILALVGMLGASCNSYQRVAENDGIYSSETRVVEVETEDDKNNYYKQYFSTKAAQLEEIPEEDLIFTDIEAYTTTESLDEEGYVVVEENYEDEAYGGWGTNSGEVTVNVYNTGWYGAGWGAGWYGGWHGWYGPGWWYNPWNRWGWGGYWGFYGNSWFWNGGFYHPWNWYNPYFYNPYHRPFYYGNNYGIAALNRGRSNQDYLSGRSNYYRGRTNANTARNSYSRTETARRRSNSAVRTSRYNTNRARTNRVYSNPSSRTQRSYNSNRSTIRRNNTSRPTNTRPTYSRPSSTRSSGSFNRGGGGTSRGGGSRGGRGGRG